MSAIQCYQKYEAWCISLGIRPADYLTWMQTLGQIEDAAKSINCGGQRMQVVRQV
jgi:hypothetical protein